MAWLEQDPRSKHFKVCFRWGGSRVKRSLKTCNQYEAQDIAKAVEAFLIRLERGWAELPAGADIVTFALSNGKLNGKPALPQTVGLGELFDLYRASLPTGALEVNSLATAKIHMKHFERVLGARFPVENLTHDRLQDYVNKRTREKTNRGKLLSPITVRKELTTLSGVWSWALARDLVHGPFPNTGLKFPKTSERPPFQTWAEIERQIKQGAGEDLWDCVFLTLPEIGEVLDYVKRSARHPFIYPTFVFAAHTGARRSEILRSMIRDFDFDGRTVLIREKKRAKGKRTFRRVPMTALLADVMSEWFAMHPGGLYTISQPLKTRTKTRPEFVPLTVYEADHHFRRTVAGMKWEKLPGWHVFRHSFASNCAARALDQRLIDEWMGHQTEEMRKRYRHLFPSQQQQAIDLVFAAERE